MCRQGAGNGVLNLQLYMLARRIAGGGGEAGGADLSVYDGFLKGAVTDGR